MRATDFFESKSCNLKLSDSLILFPVNFDFLAPLLRHSPSPLDRTLSIHSKTNRYAVQNVELDPKQVYRSQKN